MSGTPDWVRGDALGLELPVHPAALRAGGAAYLTRAFQAFGALAPDNRVVEITQFEPSSGGSTGRKLRLGVRYARAQPNLPEQLFAKFSRDLDDPQRDLGRAQMAQEIAFARLARAPQFPIVVPAGLYADYHAESGSGVLITQRIGFGRDGIEPLYEKCRDAILARPQAHYAAILRTLAQLAAADHAGRLPAALMAPLQGAGARYAVADRASYSVEQVRRRVARYAEFATRYPALIPSELRTPVFLADLMAMATRVPALEPAIRRELEARGDYLALSHWNANLDNAWFWPDHKGELQCGLLDWGCAGRMNLAMAIWGALSAAEPRLWDVHFEALTQRFVDELALAGGPRLALARLQHQVLLYASLMGVNWLLDVPAQLRQRVPDLAQVTGREDPRIADDERARTQLHMLIVFLSLWQRRDVARVLDRVEAAGDAAPQR